MCLNFDVLWFLSSTIVAGQQTKMLAREDPSFSTQHESNADDLLMEVDCEDDASIVVIDDDVEQLFQNTTMKINDVKSLQPTKNLLDVSKPKNGEEPTQMGATVDAMSSSHGQALPLLQNFSQPKIQRFKSESSL